VTAPTPAGAGDERAIWEFRTDVQQAAMLYAYQHGKLRSGFTNRPPDIHWSSLHQLIDLKLIEAIDQYSNYRLTDLGRKVVEAGRE